MSKKIIFQKCSFNYIFFLFYTIMKITNFFLDMFIQIYFPMNLINDKKKNNYLPHSILNLYIKNLSDFISIIPYFIRKKILEKKERKEKILPFIINKEFDKKKRKKIIQMYSAIIGICEFVNF